MLPNRARTPQHGRTLAEICNSPYVFFSFPGRFRSTFDPDPSDLRGGKRAARRFVDWQTFFNFGDGNFRPNKQIDSKLSTPLMLLIGTKISISRLTVNSPRR